jgi:hypothetical protein
MKTAIAIIAGLSLGIFGITPAFAWHLIPESSDFTGKGTTSATKSGVTLKCTASFTGDTDASGIGYITAGSFTGQIGCSSVTLKNLPWKSEAVNKSMVDIQDVTFDSPIGNCGPSTISTKLSRGVVSFTNDQVSGGCTVSGKITTSPKLSIATGD